MWTPDYFVRLVAMPYCVHGMVLPNDDGTFDIYINSVLTHDQQTAALEHELEHISKDHLYSCKGISIIEAEADKLPFPLPSEPPTKSIPFYSSLDSMRDAFIASGEIQRIVDTANRSGIKLSDRLSEHLSSLF